MLAYQMLHQEEEQGLSSTDVDMKNTSCPRNVERIMGVRWTLTTHSAKQRSQKVNDEVEHVSFSFALVTNLFKK